MDVDATPRQVDSVAATARSTSDVERVEIADVDEVSAIVRCIDPKASISTKGLPVVGHVSMTEPTSSSTVVLAEQLLQTPGVDDVLEDPSLVPAAGG